MTYKDLDSALAVLDVRLERCTERTLSSDRDALELELLELLKVVDLDIYNKGQLRRDLSRERWIVPQASQ